MGGVSSSSWSALAVLSAASLALAGCTVPSGEDARASSAARAWPAPDPNRPVVELEYRFAEDLDEVAGTEWIEFVPDLEVCEVVLRAWPNKPLTARHGNELTVDRVQVDGQALAIDVRAAGAPEEAPGTLVEVALPTCVSPGTTIELDVDFTVRLGEGTDERLGVDRELELAWLGTAYPVLAWEPGVGWAREEAVAVPGEMASSATFDLARLAVTVPEGHEVAGVGTRTGTSRGPDGWRTATFAAPAVRDVAVTVGAVEIHEVEADGVPVHLVAPQRMPATRVEEWSQMLAESLRGTVDLLGPYPYEALWVSVLPVSDGVELTGAVQIGLGDPQEQRWIVVHELAHQWFYGLVGNNQARDPWLDEAWATAVQEIVVPTGTGRSRHEVEGALGWSMQDWSEVRSPGPAYVATVYTGGARTLLDLRGSAGTRAWDAAVRDYLREHAHAIAGPEDLRAALAHLPGVEEALAEAGAWE